MNFDGVNVNRIKQDTYMVEFPGEKHKPIIVNVEKGMGSQIDRNYEFFYNFVKLIGKEIKKNKDKGTIKNMIRIGDVKWEIKIKKKQSPLLRRLSGFFHAQGDDAIVRLKARRVEALNPTAFLPLGELDAAGLHHQMLKLENQYNSNALKQFNHSFAKAHNTRDSQALPDMIPCSPEELKEGMRGKCRLTQACLEKSLQSSFFSNPFTTLASLAFQRYEEEFNGGNHFSPDQCRYCLIADNDALKLVPKDHKLANDPEQNRKTVQFYLNLIESEFGKEKIRTICYQYGINLEETMNQGKPLTPEHIYRINMGVNNIETHDVEKLLHRLPLFQEKFQGMRDQDPKMPIFGILETMKDSVLHGVELKGILRSIAKEYGNLDDRNLLAWLGRYENVKGIDQLTPEAFNDLVSVFSVPDGEYRKIFTGRDIYYPVKPGYTIAEKETYKPWIDQQELLQTFPSMKKSADWGPYHEKLSFVICKKHLFRKHPETGYQVGALIPAPLSEKGEQRWYKVAQTAYNGYGMLAYTLIPPCHDPSLPAIKLYRSTCSDSYTIFGKKTLRTDINPLNPVGYEGKARTDTYEKQYFESRTTPLWVGYLLLAEKKLQGVENEEDAKQLTGAFRSLKSANEMLYKSEESKIPTLLMRDIVRKHDGVITSLFHLGKIGRRFYTSLREEYLSGRYFRENAEKYQAQQQKDAKTLIATINEFKSEGAETCEKKFQLQLLSELDALVTDLNEHVLTNKAALRKEETLKTCDLMIIDNLLKWENRTMKAIASNDALTANLAMKHWLEALHQHAALHNENLASKTQSDMIQVGHSLGGGCAQVFTVHHFVNPHRIPCPGKELSVIALDASGVTVEDNERFKQFLIDHGEMFKELGVRFSVTHQHEGNDPVPSVGVHLGSCKSLEETARLSQYLSFKGTVYKRKPDAKHHSMAFTKTAHATLFLDGKEGVDFTKTPFDPYELGLVESCETVKDLPNDVVKAKGKRLREKVWEFPFFPRTAEKIRSSILLNSISGWLIKNWVTHDPKMVPYLDPAGNFVVEETGLAYGLEEGKELEKMEVA